VTENTEKTTPEDVSEFERQQLRFFLGSSDMVSILTEVNPSLAWLSGLAEMNLLQDDAALALWVERNFDSLDAVREVVANIRFFKAESATFLEHRLNDCSDRLEPLLLKCWRLIIRHIRNEQHGTLRGEWFDVLPRLRRSDGSLDVLKRAADVLAPKLFVEKRSSWHDDRNFKIEQPNDVISIRYRVEDGVGEGDFFSAWPESASVEVEEYFIRILTDSLSLVLADALDVGVESNTGVSISDVDVPSVEFHEQNAFHEGFLPIVRVTAELWSKMIRKSVPKARAILRQWEESRFRLVHRLALYAAADPKISSQTAANVLIHIPQGELFLTNSRVEVHRLIRRRWTEFSSKQRRLIERRIVEGPPDDWFRAGADLSNVRDRCRFELLLELQRSTFRLSDEASNLLKEIRVRHQEWRGADPGKVGFTMWHGGVTSAVGNEDKLTSVSSDGLIQAAKKARDDADFMQGDPWGALCQNEPFMAFLGIKSAPPSERWHEWAWRPFLWAASKISDLDKLDCIARLLVEWPKSAPFEETSSGAAWWMDEVSEKLEAPLLWAVWDLVERRAPRPAEAPNDDLFAAALNDAAGHLASALLKRTPRVKGRVELGKQLRARYERLIGSGDIFARLGRVRLSAAIAFLFERAPKWTTTNIVPAYSWNSSDAPAMWSARKYSNHIGSPELFRLTKKSFLELFSRPDAPDADLRTFSAWLAAILIANQAISATYPLTVAEVRSVLRRAGQSSLESFAHRLAMEMEGAKSAEKAKVWKERVGPVFQGAWPLDVELQTPRATFKLIQILLATGTAFGEAATIILPFIRPEDRRVQTTVFSISEANVDLYGIAPEKMLDLLSAVAGDAPDRSLYGLNKALSKLRENAPHLMQRSSFGS
jgi:hypothetical protein